MSLSVLQRTRLGIFMTGGAICLFFFIAIPVGFKFFDRENVFWAYFEGESLSGLEEGATVKFNGVPVGKVGRISYDPEQLLKVKVKLEIKDDFPMKNDMFAQTGSMGITGLKYIELLGGTDESPRLSPGSEIPTKRSVMSTITGKAEVIMEKIEVLLNHLNSITDPDSLKGVKTIIDNAAEISGDAQEIITDLKSITAEANRSFAGGKVERILISVDSTTRSLHQLSRDISIIVKQSREDILVSMENLRSTMENANELTRLLSENPSLLLRGEQQKEREVQ